MYAAARHDEITGLTAYIDQQLDALRASIVGLTEEQAVATPCRSTLSIAGLLKHATYGMTENTKRLAGEAEDGPLDEAAYARYMGSFVLGDDESGASTLAAFD